MVLIVLGLAGSGDDLYPINTSQAAIDNGYDVCVVNHRGGADTEVTSPKFYCAGSSWDFKEALEHLSEIYPEKKFYGIGYSLGANILGKYQTEEGSRS